MNSSIPVCQPLGWLQPNLPCIQVHLDHFHDLEVAVLLPLVDVLLQYVCSTLLSFCVSPLTGVMGLAPMCLVEFLPPLSLLLQFLMSQTFCVSGAFSVGFPTVLASFPDG